MISWPHLDLLFMKRPKDSYWSDRDGALIVQIHPHQPSVIILVVSLNGYVSSRKIALITADE
jgi:hypothetical protein